MLPERQKKAKHTQVLPDRAWEGTQAFGVYLGGGLGPARHPGVHHAEEPEALLLSGAFPVLSIHVTLLHAFVQPQV